MKRVVLAVIVGIALVVLLSSCSWIQTLVCGESTGGESTGRFIVSKRNSDGTWDIYIWDGNDNFERLTYLKATKGIDARLSWDKKKLAVLTYNDLTRTLYVMDLNTRSLNKVFESENITLRNWRRNNKDIIIAQFSGCHVDLYSIDSETGEKEFFLTPSDIDPTKHEASFWWPLEDGRMILAAQVGCWSPTLELYIFRLDEDGKPYDIRQLTHNSYYDNIGLVQERKIYVKRSDNPAGYGSPENVYTIDYETGEEEKLTHLTEGYVFPVAIYKNYLYIDFYDEFTDTRSIYRLNLETKKLEPVKTNVDFVIVMSGGF